MGLWPLWPRTTVSRRGFEVVVGWRRVPGSFPLLTPPTCLTTSRWLGRPGSACSVARGWQPDLPARRTPRDSPFVCAGRQWMSRATTHLRAGREGVWSVATTASSGPWPLPYSGMGSRAFGGTDCGADCFVRGAPGRHLLAFSGRCRCHWRRGRFGSDNGASSAGPSSSARWRGGGLRRSVQAPLVFGRWCLGYPAGLGTRGPRGSHVLGGGAEGGAGRECGGGGRVGVGVDRLGPGEC